MFMGEAYPMGCLVAFLAVAGLRNTPLYTNLFKFQQGLIKKDSEDLKITNH